MWLTAGEPRANTVYVPRENWHRARPKPGIIVTVRVAPSGGGGKNPLRTILTLAVLAASIYLGPVIAAGLGYAAGTAGFAIASALGSAAVGIIGNLAVNAISPPPKPKLGSLSGSDRRDSPTLSISGARNRYDPYGPVPIVLGRHLLVPPYGAKYYTELVGSDQYLRLLFNCGYGPLQLEDLKIGETPIEEFEDVEIEIRQGFPGDAERKLFSNSVGEEPLSILLREEDSWQVLTSGLDADELSVDYTFDQGLVYLGDRPARQPVTVQLEVQYSTAGANDWTTAKVFTLTEMKTSAIRVGHRWAVARGQYDVRSRRITADSDNDRVFDRVLWTALRTIRAVDPIAMPGMASVALRIKATEQLQGVIDQFNLVATRICRDWNGAAWVEQPTRWVASLYRYMLQGPFNKRALADARIDLAGLQSWHAANVAAGQTFDAVIDFKTTLKSVLDDIAAAGRAAVGMKDGKHSVVRDLPQTVPVQHFSPRNSWDFRCEQPFIDHPHALRVQFVDETSGWRQGERIIYAPGYNAANASRFDDADYFGITHPDRIWDRGTFDLAQAKLRPAMYSLSCDVEHIVCTRGDLVRVAHDAIAVGIAQGRIKSLAVDGSDNVTAMTLDEICPMDVGKLYAVKIRRSDGSELARSVETVPGQSPTLTFSAAVAPAAAPAPGDLVLFGEADREALDCVVHHIEMLDDLAARLYVVDAAPALHDDPGEIPPYDPLITTPPTKPAPPQIIDVDSGNRALLTQKDGTVQSRILVSLAPGAGAVRTTGFQGRYRLSGSAAPWERVADVAGNAGEITFAPAQDLLRYDLQVRALGPDDTPSAWVTIFDHLVLGKTQKPSPADTFTVTRQADGTRKYAWTHEEVPADVQSGGGYRIYWFRGLTADFEDMVEVLPPGLIVGNSIESNELSAGTYTFALVTVDSSKNESEPVFAQVELGDPRLRGVLEQLFDHETGWPGTKTDCFVDTDNVLRAITTGGWDALPNTWDELLASWNTILPNASPIRYETLVVDLGADLNFTPLVTVDVGGSGVITIEMKTGSTADGGVVGAYVPAATAMAKRYLQIRVSVAGASPEIRSLEVLIDGETVVEDFEDIDTSAASAGLFERVATGHFRVQSKGDLTTITSARVTSYQNAGAGWSAERIKPAGASGVLTAPYAEFKIYKNGVLTDATVDVELKGNR